MATVPVPKLAASAIVEWQGRFLLVKRRNPPAADLYAFPGGRAEPDEALEQTALRELQEETGLVGESPRLFAVYDLPPESTKGPGAAHYHLSVFTIAVADVAPLQASDDAVEAGWYAPQAIFDLPVPDSVRDCVQRLIEARPADTRA
ncbi:NUDIX hydrolase [Rhizobium halophytocola]|nr:NUDIX domain-containing protein [Rhizobium halophytocola]